MYLVETIFGLTGFIIFLISLKWAKDIFRRFKNDEELAATKIYLKNSIVSSLKIIALSSIFFAATGAVSLYGLQIENKTLSNAVRVGSFILFASYIYFHYAIHSSLDEK